MRKSDTKRIQDIAQIISPAKDLKVFDTSFGRPWASSKYSHWVTLRATREHPQYGELMMLCKMQKQDFRSCLLEEFRSIFENDYNHAVASKIKGGI